jgi:prepilin-type N-terminal cleavage/methylation domain-containing protein
VNAQWRHAVARSGFTLIEMSVVLVIAGLIAGGVLAGRDLMDTAAQRAQIAQIAKYNTAVNTFRNKYGGLPGDLPDPMATGFGFQSRGQYAGEGDGNGILEGNCTNASGGNKGVDTGCGELAVMWEDLSEAGLIDATISGLDKAGANYPSTQGNNGAGVTFTTTPAIMQWLPPAKAGNNNFVYAFSMAGANYFTISSVTLLGFAPQSSNNPGITVQHAYNIDKKMDDGLPVSGAVTAAYLNHLVSAGNCIYAAGNGLQGAYSSWSSSVYFCNPTTAATPYAPTNCFDNNNMAGIMTYSLSQNANAQNCALSFRFQ